MISYQEIQEFVDNYDPERDLKRVPFYLRLMLSDEDEDDTTVVRDLIGQIQDLERDGYYNDAQTIARETARFALALTETSEDMIDALLDLRTILYKLHDSRHAAACMEKARNIIDSQEAPAAFSDMLTRARAHDQKAWETLTALVGPLVYAWCREASITEDDARDVVEEVFINVWKNLDRFNRSKVQGSFRRWLRRTTSWKIADYFRRQKRREIVGEAVQDTLESVPDPHLERQDEHQRLEENRQLLYEGHKLIRERVTPQTWEIYERTAIDGEKAAMVANSLGISEGAVYAAKCRVIRKLRELLCGVVDEKLLQGHGAVQDHGAMDVGKRILALTDPSVSFNPSDPEEIVTLLSGQEYYFAYGSNMSPSQMNDRCPSAAMVGVGVLRDYRLVFNRQGSYRPGGVASVTESNGDRVYGIIWQLNPLEFSILDQTEYPNAYNCCERSVTLLNGKEYNCHIYEAIPQGDVAPDAEYVEVLINAAKEVGLPDDYVQILQSYRNQNREAK